MDQLVGWVVIVTAGLFALVAIMVPVYLLGMAIAEAFELGSEREPAYLAGLGLGVAATLAILVDLFLLVKFVKWAWHLA